MARQQGNNLKLGIFLCVAVVLLAISFYVIGKKQSLFSKGTELKAHFRQLNGLMEGDNVLFSGIQAGYVSGIRILNDTTLEVILQIDDQVRPFIYQNALVAIGTDGLIGNKVINITPGNTIGPIVKSGDLLVAKKTFDKDELINTFSKTNANAAVISETLKQMILRIDTSQLLKTLNDRQVALYLQSSLKNLNHTTQMADALAINASRSFQAINQGKGGVGVLLNDQQFAQDLKQAMLNMRMATATVAATSRELDSLTKSVDNDLNHGNGPIHTLLKDSAMAKNMALTVANLQAGTDGFNQNMEALKHNFFFKGFFKRQEAQRKKMIKDQGTAK